MEKQMTIILTVSVRVTVAKDKDIDTICSNLEGSIASAYNNGIISEGCHDDTSVDAVEADTEVIDEEEEGTNGGGLCCLKCGHDMVVNEDGTTNHLKEGTQGVDDIDHEQDADHSALNPNG